MAKKKKITPLPEVHEFDEGDKINVECLEVTVKVAFKPITKKSPFHDKVVCWYTKSKFYHVEIIIGDVWISSDGKNGVHVKDLDDSLDTWVIYEMPNAVLTQEQFNNIVEWVKEQANLRYDYIGLFSNFLFKINLNKQRQWFCSEITTRTLQRLMYEVVQDLEPSSVSPGSLAKLLGVE